MQEIDVNANYKTIVRRFFAGLIDSLLYFYCSSLIFIILCLSLNYKFPLPVYWTIHFFIAYPLNIILTKKYKGTIGKLYFNVSVIDHNNSNRITWTQSIYRELINIGMQIFYIMPMYFYWFQHKAFNYQDYFSKDHPDPLISLITFFSCLVSISEIVTSLFNKKRRAIHDYIGETVVIISGKYRLLSKTITIVIYIIGLAIYMRIFEYIKK